MTRYVTDGGLETDLIFHHGLDLPEFAAFPLVEDEHGREVLTGYYDGYAQIAAKAGAGLTLDAPTWRANPDWAAIVGYDAGRARPRQPSGRSSSSRVCARSTRASWA